MVNLVFLTFFIMFCAQENTRKGVGISNEDGFFAEMHPQIAQVIGIAVMQLLVEKKSISKNTIIEMIQVLWQGAR